MDDMQAIKSTQDSSSESYVEPKSSPSSVQPHQADSNFISEMSKLLNISLKPPKYEHKEGLSLDEQCDQIRFFSIQASSINRSLALAGFAIIWIFKKPDKQEIIPNLLNVPLMLLGLSLALDLVQYFYGALAYRHFYSQQLKKLKRIEKNDNNIADAISTTDNILIPAYIKNVIDWIFYFKISTMIFAFILIIAFLIKRV